MKQAILLLTLTFSGLNLAAQVFPAEQTALFWGPSGELYCRQGHEVRVEAPPARPSLTRMIKLPSDLETVHVEGGWFWGNRRVRKPGGQEIQVLRSADGAHWHFVARWVVGPRQPGCRILAMGAHFLATATMATFQDGNQSSRVAVLTQGRGNDLRLKRLIDLGPKEGPQGIFVPWALALPDGWALVHFRTGHLWTIRALGDRIQTRPYKVFDKVPDRALAGNMPLDVAVLGCQPGPTGDLLIATRSEDAVLKGRAFAKSVSPELGQPGWVDPELLKDPSPQARETVRRAVEAYGKRQDELQDTVEPKVLEAFPELLWWELDPREGTLRRCEPPAGAPSRIGSLEVLKSFRFRFRVDGSLLMGE